jgi:hypothetical protein
MPHSGDHNPPKFPVSRDICEISEVNHDFFFCTLMMITMARRAHGDRASPCPVSPAGRADRAADSGRKSAVGRARIEGRAEVITAGS